MNQIYSLIPEGMYKELAQQLNLNHFLRNLFDNIDNVEKYDYLLDEAHKISKAIHNLQPIMTKSLSDNVLVNFPIRFVRDAASRNGATYLRWRNIKNNKNGEQVLKEIITAPDQPEVVKDSLLQAEKERVALNMQIAIIAHIMRQLSECREKIQRIESLRK
ncbi:DUF3158 family protein [Actinobacillus pleuropneumoniae]|uniref:DUF3158 family protein n=1 Tax=Actinobacillus pleuropneumoniae TaxID=715 RepID=UPI003B024266